MNRKLKKRQQEAFFTISYLRRQGHEILLWSLEFYSANDICVALEDAGFVWAANFQRWMKPEELAL
jgi:hypothetical protein